MKFEYVKVEEKMPMWRELERQLVDCPAGHAVRADINGYKLGALIASINKHSEFIRAETFIQNGARCARVVRRLNHAAPSVSAGEPTADIQAPGPSSGTYVVSSLGSFYIKELSKLANEHGKIRVPKALFTKRDHGALTYALGKLRALGHAVDGRSQRKSRSIVIPRATQSGRIILRPDLQGNIFGMSLKKLDELTRPDAQGVSAHVTQAAQTAPVVTVHVPQPSEKKKAEVIRLTEPAKFPTGNKCFICIGNGQSVCGARSDATYKGVKICRQHIRLLNSGACLYARQSMSRGPVLIKKRGR